MARKYKRRKFLIDKSFQLPVAMTLGFIGLVMLIFHFGVVGYLIAASRRGAVLEARPLFHIVPIVGVLTVAYFWVGVLVSHRIVGPAYRLVQTMKSLEGGDFTIRAHLRKGDGLRDVASELNNLGESLETRKAAHRAILSKLRSAIDSDVSQVAVHSLIDEAEGLWTSAAEELEEEERVGEVA